MSVEEKRVKQEEKKKKILRIERIDKKKGVIEGLKDHNYKLFFGCINNGDYFEQTFETELNFGMNAFDSPEKNLKNFICVYNEISSDVAYETVIKDIFIMKRVNSKQKTHATVHVLIGLTCADDLPSEQFNLIADYYNDFASNQKISATSIRKIKKYSKKLTEFFKKYFSNEAKIIPVQNFLIDFEQVYLNNINNGVLRDTLSIDLAYEHLIHFIEKTQPIFYFLG